MPIHHARILVYLGQVENSTYAELGERLHLTGASISRSLNALEVKHQMVEVYRTPVDGRRYRVRLSRKGKALIASVSGLMEASTTKRMTRHANPDGEGQA